MADYYVHAKNLSVGYNKATVLENVEFGINRGEILTLIGPNGAGKSTLLRSIAGQLRLLAGTVYIDKKELALFDREELSKRLGVVFTQRLKTELMSCRDVVATGRYPYTGRFGLLSAGDWKQVDEAMELLRLTELAEADFDKISDGQRQRVMMARAICQNPDIILLDEPTSYLDIRHKAEFLSLLQRLTRQKGLSVIMSLHELDLAKKVSDKILCVGMSGIERFGAPSEIFVNGYIEKLFSMTMGSFDEESSSMELEPAGGSPEVFVLAGAASGKEIFRMLQRRAVPFAAGIIYENDIDFPIAHALAAEVISVGATEIIGEERLRRAKSIASGCKHVICCRDSFAPWETENKELYEFIRSCRNNV